jgi:hypothetical protein
VRLNQVCKLFFKLSESEQKEFFAAYRKKRDEDISNYKASKIKQPKKSNNEVKATVSVSEAEKLLLKKLGINLTELKKLRGE